MPALAQYGSGALVSLWTPLRRWDSGVKSADAGMYGATDKAGEEGMCMAACNSGDTVAPEAAKLPGVQSSATVTTDAAVEAVWAWTSSRHGPV